MSPVPMATVPDMTPRTSRPTRSSARTTHGVGVVPDSPRRHASIAAAPACPYPEVPDMSRAAPSLRTQDIPRPADPVAQPATTAHEKAPIRRSSVRTQARASGATSREPVTVYLTAAHAAQRTGAGYIWRAADAARLREEFRLVGDLVGTLPKHTAQNQYLTVPLALSYVELAFGARRGFIRLVRDERELDYAAPSRADVLEFYESRRRDEETHADESLAHQARQRAKRAAAAINTDRARGADGDKAAATARGKRKREGDKTPDKMANGRDAVAERPAKMARVATGGMLSRVADAFLNTMHFLFPRFIGAPEAAVEVTPPGPARSDVRNAESVRAAEKEREQQEEARFTAEAGRRRQQAKMSTLVVTPTGDDGRAEYETVLDAAKQKGMSDVQLRQRIAVFGDLYDKGYAMSCGAKFGADFLAYAGDPLLVHASLAVIVMDENETVSMLDVVALGRLGDSTKKRTVLAFVHGGTDVAHQVRYVGVQWEETLP